MPDARSFRAASIRLGVMTFLRPPTRPALRATMSAAVVRSRTRSRGSVAKIGGSQREAVALRRSGGCCEMVVEHAHGLRQPRGLNAKSSLNKNGRAHV